jgi:hypothetical protein
MTGCGRHVTGRVEGCGVESRLSSVKILTACGKEGILLKFSMERES